MAPSQHPLAPGALVARRFAVEAVAGNGGMGEVYRALDQESGQRVALKLVHLDASPRDVERFAREARILSEVRHPRIVGYVAHGVCEDGRPYLVMQWLEGEDLSKRLARGPLGTRAALGLLGCLAEALSALHVRGVVHRDLKPSNVLLCDGELERATILDLGIARSEASCPITAAGVLPGTPQYMSPEQVRGEGELGPSSDIFSLGCILYECLAGRPPFLSDDVRSLYAKILFEPPPALTQLRPGIPGAVEALVLRMLEKDPAKRPPSAAALVSELGALSGTSAPADPYSPAWSRIEQRLVSVVMAAPSPRTSGVFFEPAWSERQAEMGEAMRAAAASMGTRAEVLEDGSLLATISQGRGSAADGAALAARCALRIKDRWPEALVVITTGRAVLGEGLPMGEAIDRAVEEMRALASGAPRTPKGCVLSDELTARLVSGRFLARRRNGARVYLHAEASEADDARLVLGKTLPCEGRSREIESIERARAASAEDRSAGAIVITAPAGTGKTRIHRELVRRMAARGDDALVLVGRGDPLGPTSAYAMLGDALRRHSGVVQLLDELSGMAPPDAKAAAPKRPPRAVRAQIEAAFLDWLRAECDRRPVLLVLEDLHGGDAQSVGLVERALCELHDRPLFVLGLARPEVDEVFPRLWEKHAQRMRLSTLGRRAAERLVREALGKGTAEATVARIVDQSAGNPLYLEELVREHAEGRGDLTPASLLAMMQAQLMRLPPEARRVLRAASVLGDRFWRGGVLAVMGEDARAHAVDRWLDALVEAELVQRRRHSHVTGDVEYGIDHALVREAAYELLTDEDRQTGHRRAAAWLEGAGDQDPAALAEHWLRAGEAARARAYHVRAAGEAFERNDREATIAHTRRVEQLSGEGDTDRGIARAMACVMLYWHKDWTGALAAGFEALSLLTPASLWWCRVAGAMSIITGLESHADAFPRLAAQIVSARPASEVLGAYAASLGRLLCLLGVRLDRQTAAGVLSRMRELVEEVGAVDPGAHGWARFSAYEYSRATTLEPFTQLETIEDAARAFEEAGNVHMHALARARVGEARAALGAHDEAERLMREALEQCAGFRDTLATMGVRSLFATFLVERGGSERRAEAERIARELVAETGVSGYDVGLAHGLLARIALAEDDLARAEAEVEEGIARLARAPVRRLSLLATRVRVLLARGRVALAAERAREALAELRNLGGAGAVELDLCAAAAEALLAVGDLPGLREVLAGALEGLLAALQDVPEGDMQVRLLRNVPTNALLLRLSLAYLPEETERDFASFLSDDEAEESAA
ncbi:serine/threonine-protein kinase [Polyangium aurulentum]|uniref:serine/threonine-protein kinase n=1 Tax=Polyangium aurulentum TaxID=2567896 RepID=UPI00146B9537|nr:serine/threonine-protein kinase [Polyangium aurulentum]UQA60095.1 protein kinase [Polyangium aurulentum]